MKLNSVKFYLLIGSALFLGCETVVEIDVPFKDHVLVVNSFFNPDSTWRVSVSASRHVLANEGTTFIQNATVSIHDPVTDELIEELTKIYSISGGTYGGQLTPEAGKEYKIKVVAPGYTGIEAIEATPNAVPITQIELDTSRLPNLKVVSVKLHFNDPSAIENFYQLIVIKRRYFNIPTDQDTVRHNEIIYFSIDDPALAGEDDYLDEIHFSDRLFNGKTHTISLKLDSYLFLPEFNQTTEVIVVCLRSISKSYYDYWTTFELQESVSGDPFAQPVQVFSNIENGLGIFAGYNQEVLVLKEY